MPIAIGLLIFVAGLAALISGVTSKGPRLFAAVTGHQPPQPSSTSFDLGQLLFPNGLGIDILGGLGGSNGVIGNGISGALGAIGGVVGLGLPTLPGLGKSTAATAPPPPSVNAQGQPYYLLPNPNPDPTGPVFSPPLLSGSLH